MLALQWTPTCSCFWIIIHYNDILSCIFTILYWFFSPLLCQLMVWCFVEWLGQAEQTMGVFKVIDSFSLCIDLRISTRYMLVSPFMLCVSVYCVYVLGPRLETKWCISMGNLNNERNLTKTGYLSRKSPCLRLWQLSEALVEPPLPWTQSEAGIDKWIVVLKVHLFFLLWYKGSL